MTPELSTEAAAIALCAEGAALTDAGDSTNAIARYRDAAARAPELLDLHLVLANARQLAGDVLGARATLRDALRTASLTSVEDSFRLGKALVDAGAGADAVPCFRRARAECPGDAAASAALAAALRDAQQPEAAWTEIRHALRIDPDNAVALHTAALIRHDLTDYAGALKWCERSLELRPEAWGTRVTRGYLRHLLADERGGWDDFEARALPRPATAAQSWSGKPLDGRTLLVLGEQGVGDQLQFLRFVRHPAVLTASRVVIAVQADAVSLLRAAGYDAVARDAVVETDFFVPLMSLPSILGVGSNWCDAGGEPYLQLPDCEPSFSARVRRVGVAWAGNPAHRNDAVRSMPGSLLHGLVRSHPSVRFVCLQHGIDESELPSANWERPPAGDWLATAREVCTLDLVITVDTGVAHLAGALGVPAWILLPCVPDWRWGARGNRTPWYPTARLFRQPERGDWARVLTNVSAALSSAEL